MNSFGGCVVAILGKDSLCIASDSENGSVSYLTEFKTQKIFKLHEDIIIGIVGLLGDIYGFKEILEYEISIVTKKEQKKMEPIEILSLISTLLYKKRFNPYLLEILVAGFTENGKPFLGTVDCIGAISYISNYACIGNLCENIFPLIQFLWRPGMDLKELIILVSKSMKVGNRRNCYSSKNSTVMIYNIKYKICKKLILKI